MVKAQCLFSCLFKEITKRRHLPLSNTVYFQYSTSLHVERCRYCKGKLFYVSMFFNLAKALSKLQNTSAYLLWDKECSERPDIVGKLNHCVSQFHVKMYFESRRAIEKSLMSIDLGMGALLSSSCVQDHF